MTTHSFIENFNVFPDCRHGLVSLLEMAVMNELQFEMPQETLRGSVVIAVTFSRHGSNHASLFDVLATIGRTVLTSSVGMMNVDRQRLS